MTARCNRAPLAPLFLVSLVAIGFEISLTRYFAITSWSEYGYWVISIALVGISASGVMLSLFKDAFVRHKDRLLLWTPTALMLCAAIGFYLTTVNPFNPLQLQNAALWRGQLWNIGKYYLALFPFFFLGGAYVGLYFVSFPDDIPRAYGADLTGAGIGGLVTLALMYGVHPFYLPAALIPMLVLAGSLHLKRASRAGVRRSLALMVIAFVACEYVLIGMNRANFNEYKSIFVPLHVLGSRVLEAHRSPRGLFTVLDDFTERLETDFSNNAQLIGAPEPPTTLGLYKDGGRLTSLPKTPTIDARYVKGALDAFPYILKPGARALLIGTRGGFRAAEALHLGSAHVLALEPDPTIFQFAIRSRGPATAPRVEWSHENPLVVARTGRGSFDIVDIASDFLTQSDANRYLFTVEGVKELLGALDENGMLSIPVSIQELPVYAIKMLRTAHRALAELGASPRAHIAVYRSAWNARILVFKRPITPAQLEALKTFCDDRSFDISYYPGIDPGQVKIWNDLPVVSFEDETILSTPGSASDAIMTEVIELLQGSNRPRDGFFDTEPATRDRPFFFAVLRLGKIRTILKKIELVPREEMASLISVAVLLQAIVFATAVLGLPLVRWRSGLLRPRIVVKPVLYFGALGLGFLFLEILLIEKTAFLLNDRTLAFALVLITVLLFSGLGSYWSARYADRPRDGVSRAAAVACSWIVLALLLLDRLVLEALAWPLLARCALVLLVVAPLGTALGFPFALGLTALRRARGGFVPWAWSLNGAFSVISTPLANLVAIAFGYRALLVASLLLYASILITFHAEEVRL